VPVWRANAQAARRSGAAFRAPVERVLRARLPRLSRECDAGTAEPAASGATPPRGARGVEGAALAALRGEGYRGFFAENWLWRALFGLAFWDIVYTPVPGAFLHSFQWAHAISTTVSAPPAHRRWRSA
jgi:hypothetical protein